MRIPNRLPIVVACALLLGSAGVCLCQPPPGPPPPTSPAPGDAPKPEKKADGPRIDVGPNGVSVFAVGVDAHELFTRLAQATGFRIIVDDTIKRSITINLLNKKATEILDSIVSAYGFSCKQVNGIFMVSEGIPKSPSSYLLSDIDAISTQYVLAPNAKSLLPVFLQDHVKTNAEQNAVILSAPTEVLRKFRQDIAQFDIPAAQIMIDVLMVEFTESGSREFSLKFNWANDGREVTADTSLGQIVYHTVATLPTRFSTDLHALVTQGKARVWANPRIATVSGQKASIFIGKQRYLSTPVQISTSEGSSSETNSIDAGVSLQMTPWTGGEGAIIVEVHPEISVMSAVDAKTGLPEKSTRRANTTVRVRDGETIILGGLKQKERRSTATKIPILGDIPVLGPLFRSHDVQSTETEMAIFITPRVLSQTGHLPADQEKALQARFLQDDAAQSKAGGARK